jgi:hypothetical protein
MKTKSALETAKSRRAQARTALQIAAVSASADLLDVKACEGHVATLEKRRSGAIASNKPDAVISIDGELLRARVAVEIAVSKSATSTARHASAVAALPDADSAVTQAAVAQIDLEQIERALKFTSALDAALKIGEQLQASSSRDHFRTPLNVPFPPVPIEVTRALERLPRKNPYDIPVNELRGGGRSNAWELRLAELIADDVTIDVDVAA